MRKLPLCAVALFLLTFGSFPCSLYSCPPSLEEELRKAKEEHLRRVMGMPRVGIAIGKLTVYRDGLLFELEIDNQTDVDLRIPKFSTLALTLSSVVRFTDEAGETWQRSSLQAHYYFAEPTRETTLLAPKKSRIRLAVVDHLESPTMLRGKKAETGPDKRDSEAGNASPPKELKYSAASPLRLLKDADSRSSMEIGLVGSGKIVVVWDKNKALPDGMATRVLPDKK